MKKIYGFGEKGSANRASHFHPEGEISAERQQQEGSGLGDDLLKGGFWNQHEGNAKVSQLLIKGGERR